MEKLNNRNFFSGDLKGDINKWRPYGDSNPGYRRERAMS
jgi:hypothetical protein